MRSHINRIPTVQLCIIHCKTIMMLCNRHNIFSTALFKKRSPFVGVKILSLEHRNKVFVTKIFLISEVFNMKLIIGMHFIIHRSGVPLCSVRRNTVNSPMDKNSEFCIAIPFRCFVTAKRFPIRFVSAVVNYCINFFQIFINHNFTPLF